MENNWVPRNATHFKVRRVVPDTVHLHFMHHHAGVVVADWQLLDELPAVLSRADVCRQIADTPLADRMAEFTYQWVGHCTAHVRHNGQYIGIVQKHMRDDVWFATSPYVGVPCETAGQAARLLLAVHEVTL